jgi:hypothetical protein
VVDAVAALVVPTAMSFVTGVTPVPFAPLVVFNPVKR